eukprot:10301140-Alexandrium_andersonii.AAC.1
MAVSEGQRWRARAVPLGRWRDVRPLQGRGPFVASNRCIAVLLAAASGEQFPAISCALLSRGATAPPD